jgi:hypothetical protein
MQEIIHHYYGGIRRGGFQFRAELHLEPHPFDYIRPEDIPADPVSEFVTRCRADVEKVQALFGLSEIWTGPIEGDDPFEPARRVLATVSVADKNHHAIAHIDALFIAENGNIRGHREKLIVVPANRLPICTPHRMKLLLTDVAQPTRRHLVDHIKYEAVSSEPASLAFSLPEREKNSVLDVAAQWLRMTVIRAVLRWTARRDLYGYGPRWRPVKPAARPAA